MKQAKAAPTSAEAISPEMEAYYNNRPLMWRNLGLIMCLNVGWYVVFTVVGPLMQLRLNRMGVGEQTLGTLGAVNSWSYSYLVMYFAWKSDHTVSRFGRRIPYLFLTAPPIVLSIVLFPLFSFKWALIGLFLMQMFFMDIKNAAIPLLTFDCMPRRLLARAGTPSWLIMASVSFFSLRYGMKLSEWSESLPYLLAGGVLTCTTLIGGFLIKEPPVKSPTKEKFRPWSAMKVAWRDPRTVVLMCSAVMSQTFFITYTAWIWLYARNVMHLSGSDTARAVSWALLVSIVVSPPFAWLVDRVSPYKLLPLLIPVSGAAMWLLFHATTAAGLIPVAILALFLQTINSAADLMIVRHAHPAELGCVTSTNSCLRGAYSGALVMLTGMLIQHSGGHYGLTLGISFSLTTMSIGLFFVYRHLMRRQPSQTAHAADPLDGATAVAVEIGASATGSLALEK